MHNLGCACQLAGLAALASAGVLAALLLGAAGIAVGCWVLLRWGDADSDTDWGQVGQQAALLCMPPLLLLVRMFHHVWAPPALRATAADLPRRGLPAAAAMAALPTADGAGAIPAAAGGAAAAAHRHRIRRGHGICAQQSAVCR